MVRLVHRCWSLLLVHSRCDPRHCLVIPPLRRHSPLLLPSVCVPLLLLLLVASAANYAASRCTPSPPSTRAPPPLRRSAAIRSAATLSPSLRAALAPASIRESI